MHEHFTKMRSFSNSKYLMGSSTLPNTDCPTLRIISTLCLTNEHPYISTKWNTYGTVLVSLLVFPVELKTALLLGDRTQCLEGTGGNRAVPKTSVTTCCAHEPSGVFNCSAELTVQTASPLYDPGVCSTSFYISELDSSPQLNPCLYRHVSLVFFHMWE